MSYLKNTPASSEPSAFCGLYSRLTFAICRLTASVSPSALPVGWTLVIRMSFILMMRNSCWPLPAFRWVTVASLMCSPVAQAFMSNGDAESIRCMKLKSAKLALPAPPPGPVTDPDCATPQDHESTSTSSLCLASLDSPLMSPILAKMSLAMDTPLLFSRR